MSLSARIISAAYTKPATKTNQTVYELIKSSLISALNSTDLTLSHLDGLITVPSLAEPKFMEAHSLATKLNLFPNPRFHAKTIDVGGAGPVSCLLEAKRLITQKEHHLVAVVAGDTITSLSPSEYLKRAESGFSESDLCSPYIPNAYNRIAEWHIQKGFVTRDQLAMAAVLMSQQASRHPHALTRSPHSLHEVLHAQPIAPSTTILECARRADGAATILVASQEFISKKLRSTPPQSVCMYPRVAGGGETSGPLYPPVFAEITEDLFTCDDAMQQAMNEAGRSFGDVDFYALYDCFPICLVKAIESAQLAAKHKGGEWIQAKYEQSLRNNITGSASSSTLGTLSPDDLPLNTHGGLMCFAAPWETPAMYNIIEAFEQMRGNAAGRQIKGRGDGGVKTSLVYGNGGIFSASSVAVLTSD